MVTPARLRKAPEARHGAMPRWVALGSRPGLAWLVRLRWLAVVGQLVATGVGVYVVEAPMATEWLLGIIAVTALTNLGLGVVERRAAREPITEAILGRLIGAVLVVDTALLTGLLIASGGPMNPFSVFYIVEVALAGLLLGARGAWLMALFTALAFGLLFVLSPADPHAHHHGASPLHLQGMWVAYALAAGFVAHFVSGIAKGLTARERELAALRERALETERLAALSAFSAGAAHELGTPLGTIAVVSRDLASALEASGDAALTELAADARLIRAEVERCRVLLTDMAERSGSWAGEAPESLGVDKVIERVSELLPVGGRARLSITVPEGATVRAPVRSLVRSLANLVRNALEADPQGEVELVVEGGADGVAFRVMDRGPGFPRAVLARLGEPFVTTKAPGMGLGIGLHLAMVFADKVGGALLVTARDPKGSEVRLVLPSAPRGES